MTSNFDKGCQILKKGVRFCLQFLGGFRKAYGGGNLDVVCDVVRVKNDVVCDVVGDVVTTSPAHCYIRRLSSTSDVVPHF